VCVAVGQTHLESVLQGPSAEEFDALGQGFVDLVPLDPGAHYTSVGLSYLVPRVYSLLRWGAWHRIEVGDEDVFAN